MSGIASGFAGHIALGTWVLVAAGFVSMLAFLTGAACTAILVNWGKRRLLQSAYALPLTIEAALLAVFGFCGGYMEQRWLVIPTAAVLLCFAMGLQNAIITKISSAVIRTTHVTGIMTDIGIELGKLVYWNGASDRFGASTVLADRQKLWLLSSLLVLFIGGGIAGVISFRRVGFLYTLPLAAVLVVLAAVPIVDDVRMRRFA